jgi:hypothetical protein
MVVDVAFALTQTQAASVDQTGVANFVIFLMITRIRLKVEAQLLLPQEAVGHRVPLATLVVGVAGVLGILLGIATATGGAAAIPTGATTLLWAKAL